MTTITRIARTSSIATTSSTTSKRSTGSVATLGRFTVLAAAYLALNACSSTDAFEATHGIVLTNATIVNTRDGSLRPGRSVLIEGARIVRIGAAGTIRATGAARQIDAGGRYLVPGYLDMHTHAVGAADSHSTLWPLLLANGITGIRDMGGSAALIARARAINADSAAGTLDAPEILAMPGDILIGITSASQAAASVQAQKAMGAGFVKLVSANRDGALAVLAEAKAQGLGVAGHLPLALTSGEASAAGWHALEHLGAGVGSLLDCALKEREIRTSLLSGAGAPPVNSALAVASPLLYRNLDAVFYQQVLATYDDAKCTSMAAALARAGTWQVPTLIRLRTASFSGTAQYRSDPNLIYVDKAKRALWEQLGRQAGVLLSPASTGIFQNYYLAQQTLVKLYSQNGVKLLAGSDLGGIWVVPGFGLHQEFRELAGAGLTPLQILQMTTLNGARFLQRESSMGTVEAGKNADLVLLDANPIEDAANLSTIAGVFLKGRYFSSAALAEMKRGVAAAHAGATLAPALSAVDPHHRH